MQLYDITIAANTSRQLDAPGSYFYYYAGSAGGADSTITLRGLSSGLRLILKPGQAFRLPQGQKETAWIMTNYANTATIIGSVLVGDGEIQDNRITGSVEVIDGSETRSFTNSFSVGVGITANASFFSVMQLWNPVGSGKNLFCKRFNISTNLASQVNIGNFQTQVNANIFTPKSKFFTASGAPTSIAIGGVRATAATSIIANLSETIFIASGTVTEVKPDSPYIIAPGNGLTLETNQVNTNLYGTFDFYEKSITS